MAEPNASLSKYHEHNDKTSGWDIYVDKGNERVGKMHVTDYGAGDNEESRKFPWRHCQSFWGQMRHASTGGGVYCPLPYL